MTVQSPERPLDPVRQLFRGAVDGLRHGRGVVRHRNGRLSLDARFHHATFVVAAPFARVLVPQMHFHAR